MSQPCSLIDFPLRLYKPLPLLDAVREVIAAACRDLSPDTTYDQVPGVVVRAVKERWPGLTPSEALMLVRSLPDGSCGRSS